MFSRGGVTILGSKLAGSYLLFMFWISHRFHSRFEPTGPEYWFLMRVGMINGFLTSYPANLVAHPQRMEGGDVKRRRRENNKWKFPLISALLRSAILISSWGLVFPAFPNPVSTPKVQLQRVPDGGIQPQVAVDQDGIVHLVYFKGNPSQGDLLYARSKDGKTFSHPIRVNSAAGTAVAVGNIRGARIAVGRRGRVYIVWNGSLKTGDPSLGRSPMLYARLNDAGKAFETERNLIHTAYGIDGGGGIAADQQGRVYVFWHAPIPGRQGEEFRRVWMTRSEDDGETFQPERIAWEQPTGACGCCSLNAYVDRSATLYVLFRSAQEMVHRDMYLLESTDHGLTFRGSDISKWNVDYCVMSTEAFAIGITGTFAAWETEKKVHFGTINSGMASVTDFIISPRGSNEKYPSLATNQHGDLLVSWTEGMGWKRGGSLHWQLVDTTGRQLGAPGTVDGVPAWSLVASYPVRDGNFVVLY
jgi:hypothetical protein